MTKRKLLFTLLISGVGLLLGVLLFFKFFYFWNVRIPTSSMANTIMPGDHIATTRWYFGDLLRGEIILFKHDDEYRICRVIGLPGETIQVKKDGVYVNGRVLPELRVHAKSDDQFELTEVSTSGAGPYKVYYSMHDENNLFDEDYPFASKPLKLDGQSYFLIGDNRDNSEDSRYTGPIKREQIWARVGNIYASIDPKTGAIRSDRAGIELK